MKKLNEYMGKLSGGFSGMMKGVKPMKGDFERLCNEYRENKRMIEELTVMNNELKADILAIMGNKETHTEGAAKATNKVIISSRFDSKALKAEQPIIFEKYSKKTSYKRFTVI